MKVLMANKYFYLRGGSEYVFFDTVRLLEAHGHQAVFFSMRHPDNRPSNFEESFVSHAEYNGGSAMKRAMAGLRILYSFEARRKMARLVRRERPDIAHLHNIYHQISPSILHTLRRAGVPVVMTLHDLKLVCPAYSMEREGKLCTACAGKRFFNCARYSCVRGSRAMSLLASLEMYLHHSVLRVYDLVDVFICPSAFLKKRIEDMGFKGELVHLPNFVDLSAFEPSFGGEPGRVVYFGRLSEEKGLFTLIEAMGYLPGVSLSIVGDGPLRGELEARAAGNPRVSFEGYKSGKELYDSVRRAMLVVFPSECYENNPRSIIEAFALGKPVVGSEIGGIPELVRDGDTGLLFQAGNARECAAKIKALIEDSGLCAGLGARCRAFAERGFGAQAHYERLMSVFERAMKKRGGR